MKLNQLVSAALLALGAAAANAAVIDFNDNPDNVFWVKSVTSDGFVATEQNSDFGSPPMGTAIVFSTTQSNGTVHLNSWTNVSSDSVWTLTSQSGSAFSLQAFDFGSGYAKAVDAVSKLTLTGTLASGGTVSQVFDLSSQSFQTLLVNASFSGLSSVTFDAYGPNNRAAYDNIVVNSVSTVPEPANLALFGLGLAAVAAVARRKQRA